MMAMRVIAAIGVVVSLFGTPAMAQSTQNPPPPPTQQNPPATSSQTPPATSQQQTPPDDDALPIDLNRVKKQLQTPGPAAITDAKVKFTLEVIAHQPTMKKFYADGESMKYGPVKGSVMSYSEFLDMVNPKELHSSAGFTATEDLQAALVNWAVHKAVAKGINALKNARDDAEVSAIRAQIDRELAAIRGGGGQ
jgi:hypothetical protein